MWINRENSAFLKSLVTQRPVVVLTGARQVGKTSLLKHLLPDHHFVSLDLPLDAEQAEESPETFFTAHPPPLIIDEVQYAPGVFRHVKVEVDKHRQRKGRFVLTGSQKFALMKNVADSLAGRAAIVEMEPLSYREIHRALPKLSVEAIVLRGGYPELYEDAAIDRSEFYRSYLASYLERDVRGLLSIGKLRDFERFVRACALRSAQLLNRADLARDVGISSPTANEWLGVLVASNQVTLLEPWFSNATKSMVKTPKLYWNDAGFLAWLLGVNDEAALMQAGARVTGALWETFVFSELRRRQLSRAGSHAFYFWRDRDREADFLLHHGDRFELMDAKWTAEPNARDGEQLDAVAKQLGEDRVVSRRVLCRTPKPRYLGATNAVGPNDAWFDDDAPA